MVSRQLEWQQMLSGSHNKWTRVRQHVTAGSDSMEQKACLVTGSAICSERMIAIANNAVCV